MPQLGESIAEATVVKILVKEGDPVEADKDVIEVETNKATMKYLAQHGDRVHSSRRKASYPVGATLVSGGLEEEARRLGLDEDSQETAPTKAEGNAPVPAAPRRVEPTVPAFRSGACRRRQLFVAAHEGAYDTNWDYMPRTSRDSRERRGGGV